MEKETFYFTHGGWHPARLGVSPRCEKVDRKESLKREEGGKDPPKQARNWQLLCLFPSSLTLALFPTMIIISQQMTCTD